MLKYLLFIFSSLLISCNSNIKAPENISTLPSNINAESSDLLKAKGWVKEYQLAKSGDQSCERFRKLSNEKDFPLKYLAFIHSIKKCDLSKNDILELREKEKDIPMWLLPNFWRTSYSVSFKNKIWSEASYHQGKLTDTFEIQKDKIDSVKLAIAYAKKDNDKARIEILQDQLYQITPKLNPQISKENIYYKAKDYEKDRQFFKARKLYREIILKKEYDYEFKVKAYNRSRLTHKLERNLDTYVAKTLEMGRFLKDELKKNPSNELYKKNWIENQIKSSRAVWTDHKPTKAIRILQNVLKTNYAKDDDLAWVYWILGSIHSEAGRKKTGINLILKAAQIDITDRDLKNNVHWSIGKYHFKKKNYEKAAELFSDYRKSIDGHFMKMKLLYWEAISLERSGAKKKANEKYQELASLDSFNFYSIMAHRKLKKPFPKIEIDRTQANDLILDWLLLLNENNHSWHYLDQQAENIESEEDIRAILPLYAKAKYYHGALPIFFKVSPENRNEFLLKNAHVIFPMPFQEEVQKASTKFKIEPAFIYSIMRQESAFNPKVRSWAHAYGLLQLTPETAKTLARRHKLPYKKYHELYEPNINIPLGVSHLFELKRRMTRRPILMAAAYNAKESAVKKWFKERYHGNVVDFIEAIPYGETKNYVKLIIRNYTIYKRLESGESIYFPEDILKI